MRAGANRVIGLALLASLALHAALLAWLPQYRELAAIIPGEPEPLIARVERVAPPPKPAPADVRRPAPPQPAPAPRRPEPVAKKPAPAPEPAPAAPRFEPQREPAPAPAPRAPLAVIEPRLLVPDALPAPPAPDAGALERYRDEMHRVAARFKRYPRVAIDNDWEGEVVLRMVIGADGRIVRLAVARGSGYEVLDRQAREMFEHAKAYVTVPAALRGREFELELRAIYSLRDQRSG